MKSCISIYLGNQLEAVNMIASDVWAKGCLCPGCYDHIYLVEREQKIKYLAHCPRKESEKIPCRYRSENKAEKSELIRSARNRANRTVELFHRYFRKIIDSFLPNESMYHFRLECLEHSNPTNGLNYVQRMWNANFDEVTNYALSIINVMKGDGESIFDSPEEYKDIKKLFDKAARGKNHVFSTLCVLKYLKQDRAIVHLEALFLYCNYTAYLNDAKNKGRYHFDNVDLNIKTTILYVISVVIFCPWLEIVERLEKGQPTDDLATKILPSVMLENWELKKSFAKI